MRPMAAQVCNRWREMDTVWSEGGSGGVVLLLEVLLDSSGS